VIDWSRAVSIGARGRILFQLVNDFPIVQLQVRLGSQVIGEVIGTELRDVGALYFSVPRVNGVYNVTIFAKDSTGCEALTTAARSVTVQ